MTVRRAVGVVRALAYRCPLWVRIAVGVAATITALSLFMYAYFPTKLEHHAVQGLAMRARAMADLAAYSLAPSLHFGDAVAGDDALRGLKADPDLRYVVVEDSAGRMFTAHQAAEAARHGYQEPFVGGRLSADGSVYCVRATIVAGGRPVGVLHVGFSTSQLQAAIAESQGDVAFIAVLTVLAGVVFALLLGAVATRDLTRVTAVVRRIALGHLDERAPRAAGGEVAELASAFNVMLDTIELNTQRLEQEITHREAAEAMSRTKSEFVANMSHEVRTPMNGVLGMATLLKQTKLSSVQHRYLDGLIRSGESMLQILDDILDFSKIEAGKLAIDPVPMDLDHCIRDVLELLAPRADAKGIELVARYASDAPKTVIADPVRLRQLLINFVTNAVKFTDEGHVLITVIADVTSADRGQFVFSVQDTGCGIPPEQRSRIFEKFTQADASTTRRVGGTGLGLAICKHLVELMDGRIGLESQVGVGSTFWFQLELPLASDVPATAPRNPLEDTLILTVGGPAHQRTTLGALSIGLGARHRTVATGEDAITVMHRRQGLGDPYDVLLVDSSLPDMPGAALANIVSHDPSLAETGIVLLYSPAGDEPLPDLNERVVTLMKPVTEAALAEVVATLQGITPDGDAAGTPRAPAPTRPSAGRGACVLLVEDNETNQEVATEMLSLLGYRCEISANGRDALEAYDPERHAVILMDCEMPVMDGYAATGELRRRHAAGRHVPIIAMTANVRPADRNRCLAAGMDDFIPKPVKLSTLERSLAKWVARVGMSCAS